MLWSFCCGLLLVAASSLDAATLVNGDFSVVDDGGLPVGWEISAEGYEVSLDSDRPGLEPHSLRVHGPEGVQGGIVEQVIEAGDVRTSRHRLTGMIRTEGIVVSATLVAIVNDEDGATLFSDDMVDRVVRGDTDWASYQIDIPALPSAESVTVAVLVIGPGTAWFDDLELEAVADKNGTPSEEWLDYVEQAVDVLEDRYVASDRVDWEDLRAFARESASHAVTQNDAHSVVAAVIARLDDSHATFVRRPPDMAESEDPELPAVRPVRVVERSDRLRFVTAPGIEGDPLSEASTEYVDGAHEAIAAADSEQVCGWIVDLRESGGGTMWPVLAALGPILGTGELGYFIARDPDEKAVWFYRDSKAGMQMESDELVRAGSTKDAPELHNPQTPVAVLVSEDTASAGEAVAFAFIGRDRTRLFGQPTFGHASVNGTVPMPDGAMLVFPVAYAVDRNGVRHFPAISPDVEVEEDQVEVTAEEWLLGLDECAG